MYRVGPYTSKGGEMEADEVELRGRSIDSHGVNGRLSNGPRGEDHEERSSSRDIGNSTKGIAIMKAISVTIAKEDLQGANTNSDDSIWRSEHVY
jgi:hypothetical protein